MVTAVTYFCDPESLGGIDPEAFVAEFIGVVRSVPRFAKANVSVDFGRGENSVTTWRYGDDETDCLRETFRDLAEKAFNNCCARN